MVLKRSSWFIARWAALGGLLLANGCFARLERSFDFILAPEALGSAVGLPLEFLAPLARLFLV